MDRNYSKIQDLIRDKEYYEAAQLYSSLAERCFKTNDYSNGLKIILDGSKVLSESEQYACVLVLTKVLFRRHGPSSGGDIESLKETCALIYDYFPVGSREYLQYEAQIFKALETAGRKFNHIGDMCNVSGLRFYEAKNHTDSIKHFLKSGDPGSMSISLVCCRLWKETDSMKNLACKIVASSILIYICMGKLTSARILLSHFVKNSGISDGLKMLEHKEGIPLGHTPNHLINYSQLCLMSVLSGSKDLYITAEKYYNKSLLEAGIGLANVHKHVGKQYFGIGVPQMPSLEGKLGKLLGAFV